ncbi:hypothetical protein SAMN05192541_124119 [Bradyrhizobium arachidis]|nr:hypothetical protein SAMN05192541_124119 [Bradyrhizobium arachidis]
MISRRLLAAAAILCAMLVPVHAQKTKAQLNTEIGANFPDQTAGQITPQNLRTVTQDIVNSIMPTAPVTANSVPCFDGTTGLLKGCGSGALTVQDLNTIRFASQYGQADWCANLVAAVNDIGNAPGTIVVDSAAGPNACSAGSTIQLGSNHRIEFVSGNVYVLNQTLQFGNNGTALVGVGGGNGGNAPINTGVVLKWIGGTGCTMIYMFNTSFSQFRNIGLDANNTLNCVGIMMDSNNNPITTRNILEQFEITGTHVGIVVGSADTSAVSGGSCSAMPSQSGCSENDFFAIRHFQIFGNCSDTAAEGIRINSLNAAQNSLIGYANMQCVNVGVRMINMNDNLTITGVNSGSAIGSDATLFRIESTVINGPDLISNESEAGSFSVVDHAVGGAQTWAYNQWNQPCTSDGGAIIASISNLSSAGNCTASGTVKVKSIGDNPENLWTTSGSGVVDYVPSSGQPLPGGKGGTGLTSYTTGDLIVASGATALSKLADAATGSVLCSGGAGVVPAYCKVTSSHVNAATGSGSFVFATSPTLTTPSIGAATYTSLQNTANLLATISAEKAGGDLFAYRFSSGTPRMTFGAGGGSGSPFFGSNIVWSGSGNVWNYDTTGSAWWLGNLPGFAEAFALCANSGTSGTAVGSDTTTRCGFFLGTNGMSILGNANGASQPTGTTSEFATVKASASGTAPGAGYCKIGTVAGTNAGTCKLVAYCGTSTTPTTIIDNVGGGC